jgi:uncharacterized integral membrane protein
MRYVYIALIAILAAIVGLFKFQNLDAVTVSLFSASMTLPASTLVFLVYVLGMLTGSLVVALVRSLLRGARRRPDSGSA